MAIHCEGLRLAGWDGPRMAARPGLVHSCRIGDLRLSTDRWWEVHGERERVAREQPECAEAERLAKPAAPISDWWWTAEGTARMRAARP